MVPADVPSRLRQRAPRVVVLGDVLLDGWWIGHTDRIAREAPAPVVEIVSRSSAPGGAGNTAANLAALGAQVRLVGVVGDDRAGETVLALLRDAAVDTSSVLVDRGRATVTKDRVVVGDHILLRLDEGRATSSGIGLEGLAAELAHALSDADALVVCDYGIGARVQEVKAAFAAVGRPALVVVDAHDPTAWAELGPDLATPNAAEAFAMLGVAEPTPERAEAVARSADTLLSRTGAAALVVTLDRDGTVVLDGSGRVHRTQARPGSQSRASGAGDTFVAALTAARAAGLELPQAADLAQVAADVVVSRFGTSVCTTSDLLARLQHGSGGVLSVEHLCRRVEDDRREGRRIVFTNGCFDVLHRGHIAYLEQAAELGDILVVAVNSDDSVRRLKGPERPINAVADRAGLIAALGCVDYVAVFDSDTPIPLLQQLRPEIYAKGGDYSADMLAETPVVEAYGGEVRVLDYLSAQSTTEMVARIRSGSPSLF